MTTANRAMLYSTAIHEAGHAVVMERVGIGVREIRLDGDCDDPRGGTDALNSDEGLPEVDRLAAILAGIKAQRIFGCLIKRGSTASDHCRAIDLLKGYSERESDNRRNDGFQRAQDLIEEDREKLRRLADLLVDRRKIGRSEFLDLMRS